MIELFSLLDNPVGIVLFIIIMVVSLAATLMPFFVIGIYFIISQRAREAKLADAQQARLLTTLTATIQQGRTKQSQPLK